MGSSSFFRSKIWIPCEGRSQSPALSLSGQRRTYVSKGLATDVDKVTRNLGVAPETGDGLSRKASNVLEASLLVNLGESSSVGLQ